MEGCREYSDEFHSYFIAGDRTWEVARIMGFVSGIAATVATVSTTLLGQSDVPEHSLLTLPRLQYGSLF